MVLGEAITENVPLKLEAWLMKANLRSKTKRTYHKYCTLIGIFVSHRDTVGNTEITLFVY